MLAVNVEQNDVPPYMSVLTNATMMNLIHTSYTSYIRQRHHDGSDSYDKDSTNDRHTMIDNEDEQTAFNNIVQVSGK